MGPPRTQPVGLQLTRTAKLVGRAFDDALAKVGGSLPVWLVLLSVKKGSHAPQRELAASVGVEGPTLTHHLNRLEREGLLIRQRDPANRRVHQVALTDAGEEAFFRMLGAVQEFDQRLRAGFSSKELAALERSLARLRENVAATDGPGTRDRRGSPTQRRGAT